MNNRQGRQANTRRRQPTREQKTLYIQGNTLPKERPEREPSRPLRKVNKTVKRNQERVRYMNLPYVMFLTGALVFAGIILIGYLQMQAQLTVSIKNVAALESELNNLKLTNDENLDRINSAVNLEEIKKVAVTELGMTYAKEGQIVKISGEGSDYVRQLKEMP